MSPQIKNSLYKFQNVIQENEHQPQEIQDHNVEADLNLQQQNVNLQEQDNAVKFSDMTKAMVQIDEMAYTYMDGRTEKVAERRTRENSSMSHVIDALKLLNTAFKENVTPEDLINKDKVKEVQGHFLTVCQTCRTYLRRHKKTPWTAEGRARRQMIEDLLEQSTQESIEFYERVKSYQTDGIPQGVNITTWNDVLLDVRTEEIDTEKPGVTVSMSGGATSTVRIIETTDKNGKTIKRYFKETEESLSSDYKDGFKKYIDRYDARSKDEKVPENERNDSEVRKNLYEGFLNAAKRLSANQRDTAFTGNTGDEIYTNFKMEFAGSATAFCDRLDDLENDETKADILNELKTSLWMIRQDFMKGAVAEKARIKKGSNLTKRNAATSRLADLLGVSDLVVKSNQARIDVDGKKMHGVIMEEAKGKDMDKITDDSNSVQYTGDCFRKLINLQIFDTLCAQIDRHQGNFKGKYKTYGGSRTVVSDIKGIDNDMSFGTLKFKDLCKKGNDSYFNMTKITDENGNFALPAVEREFALKILALEEEQIRFQMADLLDDDEMNALVDRIKGVKNLLQTTMRQNPDLLIGKKATEQWDDSQRQYKIAASNDAALRRRVNNFTYFGPKFVTNAN